MLVFRREPRAWTTLGAVALGLAGVAVLVLDPAGGRIDVLACLAVTASQVTGTYVDPKNARTTVAEWCETWLSGYATRRPRTVRQAQVHVAQIQASWLSTSASSGASRMAAVESATAPVKFCSR